MCQQMRRALAAAGLTAVLLLALPAPSRAAGFRDPGFAAGLMDRAWSWLWSLMPAPASPHRQGSAPAVKDTTGPSPDPTLPPAPRDDQGSMIDPDGKA